MRALRSRRESRAAILSYLWCSGGSFRPELIEAVGLTDASVSRIVAELRSEGLVVEAKRTAPYQGGPSSYLSLSPTIRVAAIEISNSQIHAALGVPSGAILHDARYDLPDGSSAAQVERAMAIAVADLARWSRDAGLMLDQVAASVPGYDAARAANPIVALDPDALRGHVADALPDVPLTVANSIVARAVAHRVTLGLGHAGGPYFFVYAGHGVAGALVDELAEAGDVQPLEIGHTITDPDGPACRCGHRGCLEPQVSTQALATTLGMTEAALLARGDRWADDLDEGRTDARLLPLLERLGVGIGNALNLVPVTKVVVTGWPSALPQGHLTPLRAGIAASRLGGADDVILQLGPSGIGREPETSLALAAFSFFRRGGERGGAAGSLMAHSR